jgi:SAM-dependent methyltransferase
MIGDYDFSRHSHLEQYQDIIINDEVISKGVRSSSERYRIVSMVASTWKRPITILDIGANLGFFTVKLAKNFDSTVVALEGVYGDWLQEILEANHLENIVLLKKVFSLDDLRKLAEVEHFDLVLALSVVHHFDNEYDEIIDVIKSLGDISLIELANEKDACGQNVVRNSYIPKESKLLGYYDSHLEDGKRPMFLLEGSRKTFKKSYMDTPLDDLDLLIKSNFFSKKAVKSGYSYDWHKGINLKTWIAMGGTYPHRSTVVDSILKKKPLVNHGDLYTHNIIIQGHDVQFIDSNDPRREEYDDDITILKVIQDLQE